MIIILFSFRRIFKIMTQYSLKWAHNRKWLSLVTVFTSLSQFLPFYLTIYSVVVCVCYHFPVCLKWNVITIGTQLLGMIIEQAGANINFECMTLDSHAKVSGGNFAFFMVFTVVYNLFVQFNSRKPFWNRGIFDGCANEERWEAEAQASRCFNFSSNWIYWAI